MKVYNDTNKKNAILKIFICLYVPGYRRNGWIDFHETFTGKNLGHKEQLSLVLCDFHSGEDARKIFKKNNDKISDEIIGMLFYSAMEKPRYKYVIVGMSVISGSPVISTWYSLCNSVLGIWSNFHSEHNYITYSYIGIAEYRTIQLVEAFPLENDS